MKQNQMTAKQLYQFEEALGGMLFIQDMDNFIKHVITSFRIHAAVEDYSELNYNSKDFVMDANDEKMLLDLLFTIQNIKKENNDELVLPEYEAIEKHEL